MTITGHWFQMLFNSKYFNFNTWLWMNTESLLSKGYHRSYHMFLCGCDGVVVERLISHPKVLYSTPGHSGQLSLYPFRVDTFVPTAVGS
jgi:hypothetical protein